MRELTPALEVQASRQAIQGLCGRLPSIAAQCAHQRRSRGITPSANLPRKAQMHVVQGLRVSCNRLNSHAHDANSLTRSGGNQVAANLATFADGPIVGCANRTRLVTLRGSVSVSRDDNVGHRLAHVRGDQVQGVHVRVSGVDTDNLLSSVTSVNSDNRRKAVSSAEKVRELAQSGKWASQIAVELGLSRQRVYQIAEAFQIELPASQKRRAATVARPPQARVQTGGVSAVINHSVAGTISELLVAADLMARGWQVFMPIIASRGHDLIAVKDQRLITIEVRSAHRNSAGTLKFMKKADCVSEFYGLVVTGEPVSYIPELD